jgi:hypothetical protein
MMSDFSKSGWLFGCRQWVGALLLFGVLVSVPSAAGAQDSEALDKKQEALSSRYSRFEKLLLQMAEYLGRTDPDRAELLMRALSRSREERISTRMNGIVEILKQEDFDENFLEILEGQELLIGDLRNILELLQSEDRRSELEEETARIKGMLKDVNKLIGDQKIARATAARAGKPSDGIKSQERVAGKTKEVLDRAKAADAKKAGGDEKSGDEKSGDEKSGDEKGGQPPGEEKDSKDAQAGDPKAGDPKAGDPKAGDPKSGDPKAGDPKAVEPQGSQGQPQSSDPQQGSPQGGQPQDSQQQQQQQQQQQNAKTPGREELEKAQKAMEQAIEQLKKEQKEGSAQQQDQALQNLMAAKEKLEEKLKQLREEERELVLAKLEARFQKMLAMQIVINASTATLGEKEQKQWIDGDFTRSRELGQLENEVGIEASKTLTILREEGTSVSFPLAVEDMREDILTVGFRLENGNAGDLTQEIQRDIVEALQEMAAALQKEMEKSDDKKDQQQQQQQSPQNANGDPVLVELIAELKMLRTLQKRINRRTRQIGREIDGDQAQNEDLLGQLDRLAERQERIRQTAIDIARTRKEQ